MQRLANRDHYKLLAFCLVMFAIGLLMAVFTGFNTTVLLVWGILSGSIYAFTNANDRRTVSGRKAFGELGFLRPMTFVALGGGIGGVATWIAFFVLYPLMSGPLGYTGNMYSDLASGFTASWNLGGLTIPLGFVTAGIASVISTWAYLTIVGKRFLPLFSVYVTVYILIDALVGVAYFRDPFSSSEAILLPILAATALVFVIVDSLRTLQQDRSERNADASWIRKVSFVSLVGLYIGLSVLTDFVIRSAVGSFSGEKQFFIGLSFRASYFSIFMLYSIGWFAYRVIGSQGHAEGESDKRENIRGSLGLVAVTVSTIVLSFAFSVPVRAANLAVGPISWLVGNVLFLSLAGILYGTDGNNTAWFGRFKDVYLGNTPGGKISSKAYIPIYLLFVALTVSWLVLKYYNI